jgi:hypothetical protein
VEAGRARKPHARPNRSLGADQARQLDRASKLLRVLLEALHIIARVLAPFLPHAALALLQSLGAPAARDALITAKSCRKTCSYFALDRGGLYLRAPKPLLARLAGLCAYRQGGPEAQEF